MCVILIDMLESTMISEQEALELRELFLEDDDAKDIQEYIRENLTSKTDWRASYKHLDVYNKVNFYRGILTKLEQVRRVPACFTVEEIIKMLYTMGYGLKRIVFLLWKWGFEIQNRFIVSAYIKRNRTELNNERQKFMALIDETKNRVFQDCIEEVKTEENKTVKIYLTKLAELNAELESLDCVEEHTKARRLRRDIMEMTEFLNKVHGVTDVREAVVRVASQKAILREQKRLQGKSVENLEQSTDEEVGATFLEETSETLPR